MNFSSAKDLPLLRGFTPAPAPKSPRRRALMEGPDLGESGGGRTGRKARKAGGAPLITRAAAQRAMVWLTTPQSETSLAIPSLTVFVPIELQSSPNQRLHWRPAAALKKKQRKAVTDKFDGLVLPALPVDVRITRLYAGRQREFDDDNATAGAKAIRDAVAAIYGVSDKDKSIIRFTVEQRRGEQRGVFIRIVRREVSDIPEARP